MSNMASAATVGSNHNSRAGDGEILADRGFWPGLSVSLKHNSRFAAFCLIAKGAYPNELHIPLPFCLVSNHEKSGALQLMPGYWFRYNMYALARNAAKTAARDQRTGERQQLEYHWLAPDTVDQMLTGRRILEHWAARSPQVASGEFPGGRALLESLDGPELFAGSPFAVESGNRPVRILYAGRAWRDYGRMIDLYAVQMLLSSGNADAVSRALSRADQTRSSDGPAGIGQSGSAPADPWVNIGGQLMRASALEELKTRVKSAQIADWPALHRAYHRIAADYEHQRIGHAAEVLAESRHAEVASLLDEAVETARFIFQGIRESRRKDYENPFRNSVYDSRAERDAVLGPFEENAFIAEARRELEAFESLVERSRGALPRA